MWSDRDIRGFCGRRPLLRHVVLTLATAGFCVFSGCRDQQTNTDAAADEPHTQAPQTWFTEITSDAGFNFVHESGAKGKLHTAEITGSGIALFDYDNDGDLDIYAINGNHELPKMVVAGTVGNRLYRQEPDGRFVDRTIASGLGDSGYGMGVALADIDNDGDTDVYVTNYGPDSLYRNRGDGTFENITTAARIAVDGWSCSAAFFDYDLDGFLDLFVTQYVEFNPLKPCTDGAGRPDYCGPMAFPPISDVLLHNNGDGTFTDVSEKAGIASFLAAGLGVVSEDFNDDGWPDLYVANDAYANHLWINQKDGTFRNDALVLGAAYNQHGVPEAGMGIIAADFDNDGDLDLYMTHLNQETNTLLRNLGVDIGFADTTAGSGLGSTSMAYTGFGTAAFDAELDGDLDIVVVNGRVVRGDPRADAEPPPPWNLFAEPNLFYINDGTGHFKLEESTAESFCRRVEITRGLAIGDIDADGDLDFVISNIEGSARLYRNDAPRKGHWIAIRALDPRFNRDAIGALVTVVTEKRRFVRTITSAFGYLSASEPVAHFGLGTSKRIEGIEVRWPGGQREQFAAVPVDHYVRVVRGKGSAQP